MPLDATNLVGFHAPETDFGLDKSNLIFPVAERPLVAVIGDGVEAPVPNHKAVVRTDSNETLGVVGTNYGVLTNEDFLTKTEEAIRKAIPEELLEGTVVREFSNGSWSQREYVMPAFVEELRGTDPSTKVGFRIIATNSYDGSASAKILCGLIDFYCTNGMLFGSAIERAARRHTKNITSEEMVSTIEHSVAQIDSLQDRIRKMMASPLNWDEALGFLEDKFSARRAGEIYARAQTEAVDRGTNVFALHSALTHFASHQGEGEYASRGEWNVRHLEGRESEVVRALASPEWTKLEEAA